MQATQFFGIIHSYVEESFPPTFYGKKYYSLFKNDLIGVSWIYLMKTKKKVSTKFCLFRSWAEN